MKSSTLNRHKRFNSWSRKMVLLLFISSLGFSQQAFAESEPMPAGLALIKQASCMRCHSDATFHSGQTKIESLGDLTSRVKVCESNLNVGWFDDEINSVVDYLNQTYYHLPK